MPAFSRRTFLGLPVSIGAALLLEETSHSMTADSGQRRYHLSISPDALEADPDLLSVVKAAGVTDIWVTGFLYGYWPYAPERISVWRGRVEKAGMAAHVINVPLGHPGDSLGAMSGNIPLAPPPHWKTFVDAEGRSHAGTSLHAPATEENVQALTVLQKIEVRQVFLDDDFRLAQSPGIIGGCFCEQHRREFLEKHGYGPARWQELLDAIHTRNLTPLLREWCDLHCDALKDSFRQQQKAAPEVALGIMVMAMGSEKAGIRLPDYRNALFRVGEGRFDDGSFGTVKGKTDELFSALFHRRFARPELSYSETTAYPADRLSAANMAAKLAVSTLTDVRNTMFMSGLTAFPRTHWERLGPAMRRQADLHRRIAGHRPRGPFKHFWGEHGRYVSDDYPFSLFLAAGVPFEVTDRPAKDGWTFLGSHDGRAFQQGALPAPGTHMVMSPEAGPANAGIQGTQMPETLADLFAWRRSVLPALSGVPYVEEEKPIVCAWYPTARTALLWNLSGQRESVTLRYKTARRTLSLDALEIVPVDV